MKILLNGRLSVMLCGGSEGAGTGIYGQVTQPVCSIACLQGRFRAEGSASLYPHRCWQLWALLLCLLSGVREWHCKEKTMRKTLKMYATVQV